MVSEAARPPLDGAPSAARLTQLTGPVDPASGTVDLLVVRGADPESRRRGGRRATFQRPVRRALARYLGTDDDQVRLLREPAGRPVLQGMPLTVSLSYADDLALVAVTGERGALLGVDVERVDAALEVLALLPVACAADEARAVAAEADEEAQRRAFLRLWTAKEAVLKATGDGLLTDPRLVVTAGPGSLALRSVPATAGVAEGWRLAAADPSPGHVATVAHRGGGLLRLRRWSA